MRVFLILAMVAISMSVGCEKRPTKEEMEAAKLIKEFRENFDRAVETWEERKKESDKEIEEMFDRIIEGAKE